MAPYVTDIYRTWFRRDNDLQHLNWTYIKEDVRYIVFLGRFTT